MGVFGRPLRIKARVIEVRRKMNVVYSEDVVDENILRERRMLNGAL